MRVQLDNEACRGHQACSIAAPEIFGSDELGNAVLLIPDVLPVELEVKARRAEGNCPERAISLQND